MLQVWGWEGRLLRACLLQVWAKRRGLLLRACLLQACVGGGTPVLTRAIAVAAAHRYPDAGDAVRLLAGGCELGRAAEGADGVTLGLGLPVQDI